MASTSSAAIFNRRGQRSSTSHISGGRSKKTVTQSEYPTDSPTRYDTLAECRCRIELVGNYSEILTNFDTIKGTVRFYLKRSASTDTPQEFKSLRIQLEGIAASKFNSDNQPAASSQDQNGPNQIPPAVGQQLQNEDRFLPSEDAQDSLLSSLCFHFIKANRPSQPQFQSLGPQAHGFPFEILLTGQSLPTTFKNNFGKIEYRLVVYGCLFGGDLECVAADTILTTKGYLNLSQDPELYAPLRVSKVQKNQQQQRSLFSSSKNKRPNLKVNFAVHKGGFLPQEIMNWQLHIENPTCDKIQRGTVTFCQKFFHFFGNQREDKVVTTVLSQQQFCLKGSQDGEIWEVGRILLADGLMPTFTSKKKNRKALEIVYVIQFVIELVDQAGIEGEIPIVIGTARDEDHEKIQCADFYGGQATDWDTVSIQTCSNLPPSYSNLTSRRSSVETLPPAYVESEEEQAKQHQSMYTA